MSGANDNGRRRFLGLLARGAVVGAMGLGVGRLAMRPGHTCDRYYQCHNCPTLGECRMPQASSYLLHTRREPRQGRQ